MSEFDGSITVINDVGKTLYVPFSLKSFIPYGSSLVNTDWVYGVCVYTGNDTKIMKNKINIQKKRSYISKQTDKFIVFTILM